MLQPHNTVVVTGAAGFIGSCLVGFLNQKGFENLILVDDFGREDKKANLAGKAWQAQIDRNDFFDWCTQNGSPFGAVFHLGARTDTTEMDYEVHRRLNVEYSQKLWGICTKKKIPLVYASSAATYGGGEQGYTDAHDVVAQLRPLNPYGQSKNDFDAWALAQPTAPPFWAGVKFFNVFGPNEYHKGRMASVIFHAYRQIQSEGFVKLFRSHNPKYADGGQLRDFIFVADLLDLCFWLMQAQPPPGLYNGGTGTARTFADLARAIFSALGKKPRIEFVDTPADIRDAYQYFTEADTQKLRHAGYERAFTPLEKAVEQYVQDFLVQERYY